MALLASVLTRLRVRLDPYQGPGGMQLPQCTQVDATVTADFQCALGQDAIGHHAPGVRACMPIGPIPMRIGITKRAAPLIQRLHPPDSCTTRLTVLATYSTSLSIRLGNMWMESVDAAKLKALANGANAG